MQLNRHTLLLAPAAVEDVGSDVAPPKLDRPGGFLESLASFDPEAAAKAGNPVAAKTTAQPKKEKPDVREKPADERSEPKSGVAVGAAGGDAAAADDEAAAAALEKSTGTAAAAAQAELAGKDKAKEDTEEKWPRNSADWEKFRKNRSEKEQALRTEITAHTARVKELESKLGEAEVKLSAKPETDPEVQSEVERLRAENKQLTEALIVTEVTAHPKFKAHYAAKEGEVIEEAKRIVGQEKAPEIERILKLRDPEYRQAKLREFIGELDEYERSALISVGRDWDKIEVDRDREIKKANEHRDTVAGQNAMQAKARAEQFEKNKQKLWTETLAGLQDPTNGSPIYQKREGQPEWNAAVDKRVAKAQALLYAKNLEPEKVFRAAFDAVAFPELLASYKTMMEGATEKISTLEAQVKALSSAQPRSGNGSGDTGEKADLPVNTDPRTRTDAWAKSMAKEMKQFAGR